MSFWNDFRYGARKLRKAPGFAATSIITLALGIGATTAIFSVCDAMLWKPVPLPEIDRLAMVLNADPNDPNDWDPLTFADLEDLRAQTKSFRDITWWGYGLANIVGSNGESERVEQSLVGPNFFEVIGVQPVIGRGFQAGEDTAGRERVVVLSNGLWRRLFSSDPNVAGKTMRFDDEDYTVVGVMPANFEFPKTAQVWTPYAPTAEQRHSRTAHTVSAFGRLAPEATLASARSEMVAAGARLEREHPESNKNRRFRVDSLHDFLVGSYNRNYSELLFGASLFVLLIACANIANLQFARASGRTRELAVRTALGASRWRLMSQVLAESLLISLAGAAAGLLIASWGIEMIRGGMPAEVEKYITGWKSMGLDARALAFTLAVAVATGLLAGLAPAFQSARARVSEALKEGSRGSAGRGRHRVRGLLVAAQITLAVVLLVGASLMVRGFNALISASERFEPATLLTFRLAVTATKYKTPVQRTAFYREVIAHAQAIPGVRSVAAATALPHSNHSSGQAFDIEGKQFDPSNQPGAMYQSVNPAFFETTHTALRSGRLLQPGDGADTPRVAVISVRMAERWWPGEPLPVGRRIRVHGQEQWMTIAGRGRQHPARSDRAVAAVCGVCAVRADAAHVDGSRGADHGQSHEPRVCGARGCPRRGPGAASHGHRHDGDADLATGDGTHVCRRADGCVRRDRTGALVGGCVRCDGVPGVGADE